MGIWIQTNSALSQKSSLNVLNMSHENGHFRVFLTFKLRRLFQSPIKSTEKEQKTEDFHSIKGKKKKY